MGCVSKLKAIGFYQGTQRKALETMLIKDKPPFKFVENIGFMKFFQLVQPKFNLPSPVTAAIDYVDYL